MENILVINGIKYKKVEDENFKLYDLVKYNSYEWYVIKIDNDDVTLLMKNKLDNDKYKFCINFTIDSTQCDIPENVEFDNFIKVSTGTVSRIHIHSNEYESVLDFYRNYGNISNLYIQDMDSTV